MEEAASARLVEGVPFDVSTRGLTATLRRSDIEEALTGDGPAELRLDVRRGQGSDVEAHALTVEWSRADLDRLLREAAEAEDVTIAFDGDEMAAAIDAEIDVEAHGLREKALILTVVAVSAASTAGVAQARPIGPQNHGPAPWSTVGAAVAAPAGDPAASPATTIGGAGVSGAGVTVSQPEASPATTIGGAGVTVSQPEGSPATIIGGAGPVPAAHGAGPTAAGTRASGGSSLSGDEVALLGAAGLTIAAAGLTAASRRRRPIRPA
jgi:hypothetical protein